MEAVELELLCWGDGVAVAIHLMLAGTPVKSFGSPLSRYGASSAASDDSSAGLPDCASSGAVREAAAALDAPQQGCFGGDGSDGAATPVAAKQQGVAEISRPHAEEEPPGCIDICSQLQMAAEQGCSPTEPPASHPPLAATQEGAATPEPPCNAVLDEQPKAEQLAMQEQPALQEQSGPRRG